MKLQYKYLSILLLNLLLLFNLRSAIAFEAFTVKKIRIEGLKIVSKDVVLREINFTSGQKLTTNQAQQIIKNLYKTNFFKNIKLTRKLDDLIVHIEERSIIYKLEINGVKAKEAILKILKTANIAEGLIFAPSALSKASKEIEKHYLSKGHYGVQVESKVTTKSRNRIQLSLFITEGSEARIAEIKINGNTKFKQSELLNQLLHAKTNWLSWLNKKDRYFKEKLSEDLEILKTHYMNHGYINFNVDSTQVTLTADKKKVFITINITEGEQYKLGIINLQGEFIISKQELQKIVDLNLKPGAVFSLKLLLDTKKQIEDKLADLGFIKAEVKLNHTILDTTKEFNIDLIVVPNQRFIVRNIIISGNNLTEDFVLRRMLPQLEGTLVSNKDIQAGKLQIMRHGYSDKVEIIHHPVPLQENEIDIEYKLEERRNMQLSAGVNYSGAEGLGYEVGADIKNFIGTGKNIGFTFNNTKVRTAYRFKYFNPYFTIDGIGFGYDLFYQRNNFSKNSKITEYATDTLGGGLNWSIPIISEENSIILGLGYSKTKLHIPHNPPLEISNFTNKKGFLYKEYFISIAFMHNSLDRYIFPTKGISQEISFKYTLPMSDLKYYQINYEAGWFKPISNSSYILNFSTEIGYGANLGKDPYPFFKNHFIGGADSVRGFEERSLGPKDSQHSPIGGNLLVNFRSSIILPIPFKPELESIVRPSLFLDIGQVYNTLHKATNSNKGLRYSAGVSCAINTPLGMPIILSLAKPLNLKPGDQKQGFSFTFSTKY